MMFQLVHNGILQYQTGSVMTCIGSFSSAPSAGHSGNTHQLLFWWGFSVFLWVEETGSWSLVSLQNMLLLFKTFLPWRVIACEY